MEENNKTRYSDEELEEFRVIINEMLDKARAEYNTLREVMTHAGGNDILDTAPTFKTVEDDGAFQLSKEEAGALAQRQFKLPASSSPRSACVWFPMPLLRWKVRPFWRKPVRNRDEKQRPVSPYPRCFISGH